MKNGYKHAFQNQLFSCAYLHGKRVMPLTCERVITCRVRAFALFPEIPWRLQEVFPFSSDEYFFVIANKKREERNYNNITELYGVIRYILW